MKKLLVMGALALILAACSLQEASAWVNAKFGIGINWAYQSGGNNFLWGVFRNGQPPCCDGHGCGPGFYGPGYGVPGYYGSEGYQGYPYAQGAGASPMTPMTPPQVPASAPAQPSSNLQNNGFQTVNYPPYYVPNYYYPVSYSH
jgi:hypothetical protein